MKRMLAAAAATAALALSGCGQGPEEPAAANAAVETGPAEPAAQAAGAVPAANAPSSEVLPAAPGAPVFAVVYPGGVPKGPATLARGPSGPGGVLSFTTEAPPDQVVAFYRQRAEAAGLKSIGALSSGEAYYSAGDGAEGTGKLLNVVATPVEDGLTDVQLTWSSGR